MKKNRIFSQGIFLHSSVDCLKEKIWEPNADIFRAPWGWLIKVELAGIRPNDIELILEKQQLKILGTRLDMNFESTKDLECQTLEISYAQFRKTLKFDFSEGQQDFTSGEDLQNWNLSTEYRDGILWIKIININVKTK